MRIERIWAMPSKWTFKIKPISELLKEEMNTNKEIWLDPFAGMYSPAQYKNDLNTEMNAQDHEDAMDWLKKRNWKLATFPTRYSIAQWIMFAKGLMSAV